MTHQSPKTFSCPLCPEKTSSFVEHTRHLLGQHRRVPCRTCPHLFKKPKYLKRHFIVCDGRTSSSNHRHAPAPAASSGTLPKRGRKRKAANASEDTTVVCPICSAVFKHAKYLKIHLKYSRRHSTLPGASARGGDAEGGDADGENKGEQLRKGLKRGRRARFAQGRFVASEKKHKCGICNERYFQLKHLQRHMSLFHEGGHVCPGCSQWFRLKINFDKHRHACAVLPGNGDANVLDEG